MPGRGQLRELKYKGIKHIQYDERVLLRLRGCAPPKLHVLYIDL